MGCEDAGADEIFREARPEDLSRVLRLSRQLHPDDPEVDEPTAKAVLAQIADTPGMKLFVLIQGGAVVASTCPLLNGLASL